MGYNRGIVKWERNPGLARCYTVVLSSSSVVALGDSKMSLTNCSVGVYFSFFTAAQQWKNNAGLKYWDRGLAERGLSGK